MRKLKKIYSEFVTTGQAAEILEISVQGVHNAAKRGSLKYDHKIGRFNALKLKDVLKYKKLRKPGRPKKKASK